VKKCVAKPPPYHVKVMHKMFANETLLYHFTTYFLLCVGLQTNTVHVLYNYTIHKPITVVFIKLLLR